MTFEPWKPVNDPRSWDYQPMQMTNVPEPPGTRVGKGLAEAVNKAGRGYTIVIAGVAAKAGHNHYKQTGDYEVAVKKGVGAFARWFCWGIALLTWGLFAAFYSLGAGSGTWGENISGIIACSFIWPFLLGVPWCRFVDYSLFKRGMWYRLFQPIDAAMDAIPSPVFFLGIIVPILPLMIAR